MTEAEISELCILLDQLWDGFDEGREAAFRWLLGNEEHAVVELAIRELANENRTWLPKAPEIAARVAKIRGEQAGNGTLVFAEALRLLYGPGGVFRARPKYEGPWLADELAEKTNELQMQRAFELHPKLGAFVRAQGLARLRRLNLDDEYGELRRKELQAEWDRFMEEYEGRELALLARGRRGEIGKLDPLAALGIPPAKQIESGS